MTTNIHVQARAQQHAGSPARSEAKVHRDALASLAPDAEYTCPMHPEIVQRGPGSCPLCGMALEPKTITADAPLSLIHI